MPSPPPDFELTKEQIAVKDPIGLTKTVVQETEEVIIEKQEGVRTRIINYWKDAIRKYNLHFFFIGLQLSVFAFFQILNGKELIFSFDWFALIIVLLIVVGSFIVYVLKLYPYASPVDIMIEMTPFFFAYYSYSLIAALTKTVIYPNVHLYFPYRLEKALFGWMIGNQTPNYWLENLVKSPAMDIISALIYTFDMSVPILLCVYYFLSRRRESFELATLSILLMGLMAQVTFVLLPTSPPWYVREFGFTAPWYGRDYSPYSGAGLSTFDELTGFPLISMFYSGSSDYFAAFPSMHAGFGFISLLIAYHGLGKKSLIFTIPFNLIVYIIAIYTFHHYIIDLIAGMVYATVAYFLVKKLMKIFKREEILTGFGFKYT
ncbi:MAG: phosphatase PAP2 family protein [Candidatus Heimdallarchaeaceae archaeon]